MEKSECFTSGSVCSSESRGRCRGPCSEGGPWAPGGEAGSFCGARARVLQGPWPRWAWGPGRTSVCSNAPRVPLYLPGSGNPREEPARPAPAPCPVGPGPGTSPPGSSSCGPLGAPGGRGVSVNWIWRCNRMRQRARDQEPHSRACLRLCQGPSLGQRRAALSSLGGGLRALGSRLLASGEAQRWLPGVTVLSRWRSQWMEPR